MQEDPDLQPYLQPTHYIDSDSLSVIEFAGRSVGHAKTDVEKAVKLYYAVRDGIRYDPYDIEFTYQGLRASAVLARGFGYCVAKAIVLAAAARASGIPARLGFADVRNHLTTERLKKIMETDVFVWHGFSELYLNGRWIKTTPTFNIKLCERFGVKPLDFDGVHDALFHPFDSNGNRHMEYVRYHGSFSDLPYDAILVDFKKYYPIFFRDDGSFIAGDFEKEAMEDRKGTKEKKV